MALIGGIQLSIMIGPAVPLPTPQPVVEALTSVTITTRTEKASAFELVFAIDQNSPLHQIFMLAGGSLPPIMRVLLLATIGGVQEVLMDGVITHHQVTPSGKNGMATLTVIGEDLSKVMAYIDFSGTPYPAMPREARVALIVAKYAALGIVPVVIPSVMLDVPLPTEKIPRHQGNDLFYVQKLAKEVGYTFFVQCGPAPGMNIAYWGPALKVGPVQPALNVDMGPHTNVENLNFAFDTEKKILPIVTIHEPITKAPIPIPIPDITPLSPPLGLVPPFPKHILPLNEARKLPPVQALMLGLAKAAKSSEAVKVTGSLSVLRYGRTLKARQLVGLRGAGSAFNGLYFVSEVKHKISRGEYKQDFTLVRNGLISTVGTVAA